MFVAGSQHPCDRLLVVANGISHHLGPNYQFRMLFNILSSYRVGRAVDVRGLSLSGTLIRRGGLPSMTENPSLAGRTPMGSEGTVSILQDGPSYLITPSSGHRAPHLPWRTPHSYQSTSSNSAWSKDLVLPPEDLNSGSPVASHNGLAVL